MRVVGKSWCHILPELAGLCDFVPRIGDVVPIQNYIKVLVGTVINHGPEKTIIEPVVIRTPSIRPIVHRVWRMNRNPQDLWIPAGGTSLRIISIC